MGEQPVTLEPVGQPQGTWRVQILVFAVLVAVVVLLQAVASSNDDPGYIPSDEELVAVTIDSETPPAAARCFVAELTDEWSPADKRALVSGDMEYSTYRVSQQRLIAVGTRCGIPRYLNAH